MAVWRIWPASLSPIWSKNRINRGAAGVAADEIIPNQPGCIEQKKRAEQQARRLEPRPKIEERENERREENPDR